MKGAEVQSSFLLGGDGRGCARLRVSRGARGRKRRDGRTSSASRKASRKKESVERVRAMVVSGASVRVVACTRSARKVVARRDEARDRNASWFLVTCRGSRVRTTRVSRTRPVRGDPNPPPLVFAGRTRSKLPDTRFLDRYHANPRQSRRFSLRRASGATPRRAPRERGGTPSTSAVSPRRG